MAKRGKAGTRPQRLKILEAFFKDHYGTDHYPTVTDLATKLDVTTPTIYRDLDTLRLKMGTQYVPQSLKLGGKNYGR